MSNKSYYKEYYKNHREQEIARTRKYYEEHKEEYARKRHERYVNTPEELIKSLKRSHNLKVLNDKLRKIEIAYITVYGILADIYKEPIKMIYNRYLEEKDDV